MLVIFARENASCPLNFYLRNLSIDFVFLNGVTSEIAVTLSFLNE